MFHERESELSANLLQQFQYYINDSSRLMERNEFLARAILLMAHTISVITPHFATLGAFCQIDL
jgi:hypothetical protein